MSLLDSDHRLYEIVVDPASPYVHVLGCSADSLGTPVERDSAVPEPPSLDFLGIIEGFHNGNIPCPNIARTRALYNSVADRFMFMTATLISFVKAVTPRNRTFNVAHIEKHCDHHIQCLYARHYIPPLYSFKRFVFRIRTVAASIHRSRVPRIQSVGLRSLPLEIMGMIVSYLSPRDRGSVGVVNSYCRALFTPPISTRFVMIHSRHSLSGRPWNCSIEADGHAEHRHSGVLSRTRDECLFAMSQFRADKDWSERVRQLGFYNQWPHSIYSGELTPFLSGVVETIRCTTPTHLRLVCLNADRALLSAIAHKYCITHLTLEVVQFTPRTLLSPVFLLPHVTYLALGFDHVRGALAREGWRALAFCPNLRHFHGYTAFKESTIVFPSSPSHWDTALSQIHHLETLSLDNASSRLEDLASWICYAANYDPDNLPSFHHARSPFPARPRNINRAGRLTHLKIRTSSGISDSDAQALVTTLGVHHPDLRVLVLEGLLATAPVVCCIAGKLPNLEGLTLIRYGRKYQTPSSRCYWEEPLLFYARVLAAMPRLRHVGMNPSTLSQLFGPFTHNAGAILGERRDDGVDPETGGHEGSVTAFARTALNDPSLSIWRFACRRSHSNSAVKDVCYDRIENGITLAAPFVVRLPVLTSFAIQADVTSFSCRIVRENGAPRLTNIFDHNYDSDLEYWNPRCGDSWSHVVGKGASRGETMDGNRKCNRLACIARA